MVLERTSVVSLDFSVLESPQPKPLMKSEDLVKLKNGDYVTVADNPNTRVQYKTLGNKSLKPGTIYVLESKIGNCVITLKGNSDYWGINWFEKPPYR